jgi:hypothetical protein
MGKSGLIHFVHYEKDNTFDPDPAQAQDAGRAHLGGKANGL